MSFTHSKTFKYLKNLLIGLGAAVVIIGALFKIESWPYASELLIAGLGTEAFLFALLGILGPDKDYYWEKLYPGLDNHDTAIASLGASADGSGPRALDGEVVENKLGGMLTELQTMSKSMSSLKALQEVDFSKTKDKLQTMNDFYGKMSEAMGNLVDTADDAKAFKKQLTSLNGNLGSLNNVYGGMLNAMSGSAKK